MAFKAYCGLAGCKPFGGLATRESKLGITRSVGLNPRCGNLTADIRTVQVALNRFTPLEGGPDPQLVEDGICGPKTSAAIKKFQAKRFEIGGADGIVDVGGKTDRHLANAAGTYTSLTFEMMKHVAHTLGIIARTRNAISHARSYKLGLNTLTQMGKKDWDKLEHHFQISKFPNWQHQLQWIDSAKSKYDQLLPWQRLHNADCYSQFAFDAIGTPFVLKDNFVKPS